ncbi:hypothetical protein MNEG_12199 [Monoraphidium neglectum]|uniref:Uncharacterized protein n=1 Tax=Monoraphidium neglectum TaxID=145388 RepID=A0A0D2LWA5_9CHLO|nr:hypothetical protein MNEG_12199 [Monoraphidium neglectum]KIY95764.1 hypothetical protein MNEG_12199 [Monoraphidium neglectum]|eukprot:XP_013894784.1 hypothetical protein MNEG_12199 [Monoraphidium neglectum]
MQAPGALARPPRLRTTAAPQAPWGARPAAPARGWGPGTLLTKSISRRCTALRRCAAASTAAATQHQLQLQPALGRCASAGALEIGPTQQRPRHAHTVHQRQQKQQLPPFLNLQRPRRCSHACRAAWRPPGGGDAGGGDPGSDGVRPDAFGRTPPPRPPSSWSDLPDPWEATARAASAQPPPGPGNGGNGNGAPPPPPPRRGPDYEMTDWGWDAPEQGWDPTEGLSPEQLAGMQADYDAYLQRQRAAESPPRDKWITPLLDWQVCGG